MSAFISKINIYFSPQTILNNYFLVKYLFIVKKKIVIKVDNAFIDYMDA